MSLVDFMDESSEMYMEARDADTQTKRMERKTGDIEKDMDGATTPRKVHNAAKRASDLTGRMNKLYDHDLKHNKKAAKDTVAYMNGKGNEYDQKKHGERAMHAIDAMERHDRRHPDRKLKEGVIEFI